MTKDMIVRAWEDPAYRATLTPEQLAALPANPSGASMDELDEAELAGIVGGGVVAPVSSGYVCTLTTECSCPWSCYSRTIEA
jgi:mersacidin/lichenicidin family type 2 lantibiotic